MEEKLWHWKSGTAPRSLSYFIFQMLPFSVLCDLSKDSIYTHKSSVAMLNPSKNVGDIILERASSRSQQDSFGRNRKAAQKGSSPPSRTSPARRIHVMSSDSAARAYAPALNSRE